MTRWLGWGLLACCLAGGSVAFANEADELRERAGQLKRHAAELMERGEKAQAQRLIEEARELGEKAQHIERRMKEEHAREPKRDNPAEARQHELQHLHARLKELQTAHRELWASDAPDEELVDIRFHIRKVEELLAAKMGQARPQEHQPQPALKALEQTLQKIEHMRAAAEHLQAAEMPEIAHNLREQSQHMERNAREMLEQIEKQTRERQAREQQPRDLPPAPPPVVKHNDDVRNNVERALKQEVEALRKELESLRKQRQQ